MLDQSRARDGAPSGFRIIVPDYCRPGQVICVQARGKEKESGALSRCRLAGPRWTASGGDGADGGGPRTAHVGAGQTDPPSARQVRWGRFAGPATCQCQHGS